MIEPADHEAGGPPSSGAAPLRFGITLASGLTAADEPEAAEPVLRARLYAFCTSLSMASGLSIEPRDFEHYPALLDAMAGGELELAWLPPIVALRAAAGGRALPIALPARRGVSTFHSALFTGVGSPFQRPSDLKAARVAWVDQQSASGYLVIRAALRAQGVDLEQAFGEEHFFGSHEAVVRAVLSGTADVGATFLHHDESGAGVWRAGWGDASVHIVARVGPIPSDVIAAGIHVPAAQLRQIQSALTGGEHPDLTQAGRALMEADKFVTAEAEHLQGLENLLDFLEDAAKPWQSILPPPNARLVEPGD
ncbi:MAG: PhnD/SsuA/transferrin family substrate-binding protein [Myxococcales bacterium]|nr:PhnD/SsuA/transferrin family substrate-binding protein [Myxococcales bacterium]